MAEEREGVSFIPDETPYLDIRPQKFNVTISFYGMSGRLFGTVRQMVMNMVPADIDVSISSEKVGTNYEEDYLKRVNPYTVESLEKALRGFKLPDGYELGQLEVGAIGSELLRKGVL
jgi:hypothetical protein